MKNPELRGFTLLEILVAMMIFSVIAAASWALLDAGRGVTARGEYEAAKVQAARAALRAIEADLKGAFAGTASFDTGFKGVNGGTDDKPLDTLEFISLANQPSPATTEKEMDLARIAYKIDEDAKTEAAGLVRERHKRITETVTVVQPGADEEEVAADVTGLNLRYYDGSGWLDAWDSTTSGTMPVAVEMTVHVRGVWKEKEEIDTFTTKIYLPVAATTPKKQP